MSSLFGTLWLSVGAMEIDQKVMNATANNVANANTPGYSRQRAVLVEGDPITLGRIVLGSGVQLQKLESVRDPILQVRIQQETQRQGEMDALVTGMNQVQVMFTNSDGDLGAQISTFFASLDRLAIDPQNLALRQGVLTAAGNVANSFHLLTKNLSTQRQNLDLSVGQAVDQVNELTAQIAQLNGQVDGLQKLGEDASAFVDQRDLLIEKLSDLIDVTSIRSDNGISLITGNGTALVAGTESFALSTQVTVAGVQDIFAQGTDITATIRSGKLAGLLAVRDQKIPELMTSLDTLAAGLANAVNSAHHAGFDLSGNPGGDLFVAPQASGTGAAANLAVQITDPALIAASSDGSAASNGNIGLLSAVHDQAVVAGRTPTDFYSSLVFGVGSDVANGTAEQNASSLIMTQLQAQRDSVSGVSLDEEAANLIQFQRAYEASARMVATINDILDTTINLGRY
jgi:flagellar hook-associated protein 1 FlgK